jgi:hypothetical protein
MSAGLRVNWRDKASYAYAANLNGLGWAWEFLRRNPRFRQAYAQSESPPTNAAEPKSSALALRRWGVLRADAPDRNAAVAKVFWDPSICAHVLPIAGPTVHDVGAPGAPHHVLVCEGDRRLQLVVRHLVSLEDDEWLTPAIMTQGCQRRRQAALASLNAYAFTGHLPAHAVRLQPGTPRLAHVVQALDGALSEASHREIACAIYGERRVLSTWSDPGEHLRDTIRRSINRGRHLMNGGYKRFLR